MAKISINLSTGSFQQEEMIIGIDLGTTNSLMAYVDSEGKARVINDANKGVLVPSIIHFHENGELLVGNEARELLISKPEQTIFSVKRLLGRSYTDIQAYQDFFSYKVLDDNSESLVKVKVAERFYTPVELSALILKELKSRAEHALKTTVNRAVITVPAYFNDSQRQATRDAGKLAGLDVMRIVNEPTAASLAYGIGLDPLEEKIIAVYDLGGGTFDISILKIQNGIFEVMATNGNTFLGGDDFDRAIVKHWLQELGDKKPRLETDPELNQLFRLKAEEAKIHLSNSDQFSQHTNGYTFTLSRIQFNLLVQSKVNETINCCKNALQDAGLSITDIQEVVMVGGSTRTPVVKESVKAFFQRELHDGLNPDEAVALGAAIQADILAGNRKDILLLDVTPLSLGIETMGGLMDTIIPRNSKIPTKAGRQYTTSVDGQINMKISVYQGERDLVKENRKLAEFDLKGIPAMPAGLPKVDVNFILNADGILTVQATELRSNVKQQIEIKPAYGLSDTQVEQMLLDSITHAKEDVNARMIIEAQTEGRQFIYTAENFLLKQKEFLSEQEIIETNKLIDSLRKSLNSGSKDEIMTQIDLLNDYTRPFAERVMDKAVAKAMKGKSI